jgi:hypothetical protein
MEARKLKGRVIKTDEITSEIDVLGFLNAFFERKPDTVTANADTWQEPIPAYRSRINE